MPRFPFQISTLNPTRCQPLRRTKSVKSQRQLIQLMPHLLRFITQVWQPIKSLTPTRRRPRLQAANNIRFSPFKRYRWPVSWFTPESFILLSSLRQSATLPRPWTWQGGLGLSGVPCSLNHLSRDIIHTEDLEKDLSNVIFKEFLVKYF